jgi:alpha-mannosidase
MHKRKTVHILSHTHWDREWYLESKYTNEWLVPFFENLFKMLEREPSYKFILDGQMCMIDDWLDQLMRTNRSTFYAKQRIRKYVEEGRLIIGPYYLQPDWQLVSGEALVRNLVIGHKMAAELGAQ